MSFKIFSEVQHLIGGFARKSNRHSGQRSSFRALFLSLHSEQIQWPLEHANSCVSPNSSQQILQGSSTYSLCVNPIGNVVDSYYIHLNIDLTAFFRQTLIHATFTIKLFP